MNLFGLRRSEERFEEFGVPLLSLMPNTRFVLDRINWQGTDTDPTDVSEVSYLDSLRSDLSVRTSIRTYKSGGVVRSTVDSATALHSHLVTACVKQILPAGRSSHELPNRLEEFARRTARIKLRDSRLHIDGEEVEARVGSFDFLSVAEVVLDDRVATLIGPDGFLQAPMRSRSFPRQ